MQGKSYLGYGKAPDGKVGYCVERSKRVLQARPCGQRYQNGWGNRHCFDIEENTRSEIFNDFWNNMNLPERRLYVTNLVTRKEVKTKTKTESEESSRKFFYQYHLKVSGTMRVVCKSLFLSTLGLKEDSVYNWLERNNTSVGIPNANLNIDTRT
ncbi:hypothetical protein ACF0H5_009348 [Mactra antiquata]